MLDKDKAKEYADRIADINQQVQTGDVNFEQASGIAQTHVLNYPKRLRRSRLPRVSKMKFLKAVLMFMYYQGLYFAF
jgi:hypothetical protein